MSAADASLLVLMLIVTWSIYRAHADPNNQFNLLDLIMENGRVSRIGFGYMFALVVTSWVLIIAARSGRMSIDVIYSAYCAAWVGPIVARMFNAQPSVKTTTSSTTETTEVKPGDQDAKSTRN